MNIPLFKIYWENDDVEAVSAAIRLGSNWAVGSKVTEFEEKLANYVGCKYSLVFSSGTSALHAALNAYGIKSDSEVIVPSFTFISTANAPVFVGAKPVFADIEERFFGLDPSDVEEKINQKTKAILPVHYGGCPCLIKEIAQVANDHDLLLIEDCAEALGAQVCGQKVGTFGDLGILSFCQNKVITTGEGGAIVTNDQDVYERLKLIRSHGRLETQDYFSSAQGFDYIQLGYNFRMSNITAALGISQLNKIEKIVEMRQKNALQLIKDLSTIDGIELPSIPNHYSHVFQLFTIKVKAGLETRNNLIKYLKEKGIVTKIYFDPAHKTRFYRDMLGENLVLPMTERISSQALTLPLYPHMTREEIDYVVNNIHAFFQK